MKYSILKLAPTEKSEFVEFWSRQYYYKDESLYAQNIGQSLTEQSVNALFRWKNGRRLSMQKQQSIEEHFVGRLNELNQFTGSFNPKAFLNYFQGSGPIWRIFFLHIFRPQTFPIFDQHVFRAMKFIETGVASELPHDHAKCLKLYDDYLLFHDKFAQHDGRTVDKALWAFGKFLKLGYQLQ